MDEWAKQPRQRQERTPGCLVAGCERDHGSNGLCRLHSAAYGRKRRRLDLNSLTPQDWIQNWKPAPYRATQRCVSGCGRERAYRSGLCSRHQDRFTSWRQMNPGSDLAQEVERWLSLECEPPMDPDARTTYAESGAIPFGLLPEPLRWEFLYAVQHRDLTGRAHITPFHVRKTYMNLRRSGRSTVIGETQLAQDRPSGNLIGMLAECQRLIEAARREWSGVDNRDPRLIYLRDLDLRKSTAYIGPNAAMDLRSIGLDWIFEAVSAWSRGAPRGPGQLLVVRIVWVLADEVLRSRGTPRHLLGTADMDAIIRAVRERWPHEATQRKRIHGIERVLEFARDDHTELASLRDIPFRFSVNSTRHAVIGRKGSDSNSDEPFRFVPQPIMDWLMDHLKLIDLGSSYRDAETRAMIFVHERCGRRTSETVKLSDECISYDSQGSPYLEWQQGKPPYAMGNRLPLHQETHDVIRQWQDIKREHGTQSQWLFPSSNYSTADEPYRSKFLSTRIRQLARLVQKHSPFQGAVEGPDGNLVHFDWSSIDAYSFRHAFAQRLADATDAEGHSTTPPDVLQSYMGHKTFGMTMAYYEVTAKRRKKALDALPARRINLHGEVVNVDRERQSFGKVAVTLGHCSEPQNVAANGHMCALENSCESCPFFLVDPMERDGVDAKQRNLRVLRERASVIDSPQHILDHYEARIRDCTTIIDGIDDYIATLPAKERDLIAAALDQIAETRRRATTPRKIDLRSLLNGMEEADAS